MTTGRILVHEGIGVIEELGTNVTAFHKGDKVPLFSALPPVAAAVSAGKGCSHTTVTGVGFLAT